MKLNETREYLNSLAIVPNTASPIELKVQLIKESINELNTFIEELLIDESLELSKSEERKLARIIRKEMKEFLGKSL